MTETQERQSGAATGEGPVVVIPEPIGIMDWSYEVERSMLEPLGIRLVIPKDRAEAEAAMRTADVVFTSSALTADDIATFDNAVGILCYSVGMDYVDAKAAAAKGIPIWNCPTSNNEEVSDHAGAPGPRRPAPPGAVRDGRRAGRLGDLQVAVYQETPPDPVADHRDHRARADRAPDRPEAAWASSRRSSPTTRTSRRAAIPEVELVSLDELCARADIIVSSRGADRDVARDHQRGDAGQDEAGRAHRQRLARRHRGGGRRCATRSIRARRVCRVWTSAVARTARRLQRPASRTPERHPDPAHRGGSVESVAGLHVEAAEQIIKLLRESGRLPAAPTA